MLDFIQHHYTLLTSILSTVYGLPLTLLFLHISMAYGGQNREIQATKDIWNGVPYGFPTDIAISSHFKGFLRSLNREIQATKDIWYGVPYGLPTKIDLKCL